MMYLRDDEGVSWTDIKPQYAEQIGARLVDRYCKEIAPEFEYVSVESECEPLEMEMPNGVIFEITGHTDRIRKKKGEYGIVDLKSGAGVIGQDGEVKADAHGVQLAVYEVLEVMASQTTGYPITLPAAIIALSTSSGEVDWVEVENPRNLLFGSKNVMGYLEAASLIIEHGIYIGNPKSQLCSDRYCPIYESCPYRIGAGGA